MTTTAGSRSGATVAEALTYEFDRDGVFTAVSDGFCDVLGWRREELLGGHAPALVHPEDRGRLIQQGAGFVAGRDEFDPVWRIRHASGDYRWYRVEATLLHGADGEVSGGHAELEDVDQAEAAREALVHSERRYRLLVQNSQDVVAHQVDGVLRWISPSLTVLTGWTPDELVGRSTLHLWHPDDREAARVLRESAVGGPPATAVLRLRCRDGHYVHVDAGVRSDGDLSGHGVVATLRDATERVAALESLHAREDEYRLIAENAGDMVALFGLDCRIQWVSPSVDRLLGVTPEAMLGSTLLERTHPDDLAARQVAMETVDAGSPAYLEARFSHADGHYVWLGAQIRPVHDVSGTVVARLGNLRDVTREVEARHALEEREAEFRLLAENAADIVFRLDDQGRFTWLSPSVQWVLGRRPEDLVGRDSAEHVHPDDLEARRQAIEAAVDGRTAYEARYQHADGTWRWLSISGHPLLDDHGRSVGRVGSAREIGAEVAGREALERSEAMFRLLAENSVDIVTQTDLEGVVQWTSPSVREVLGWEPEELIGRNLAELIHADDLVVRDRSREHVHSGGRASHLARYRHKDGRWLWLSARGAPLVDERGTVVGAVGSARDATAEVEAREALERSEAMFRLLAEYSADIVVRSTLTGIVEWTSPSVAAVLGWAADELVGRDFLELLHPDDVASRDRARALVADGMSATFAARYRHKDGRWVWLSVTVAPMLDTDGRIVGVVGSGRDATAEIEAQRALQRSESEFRLLAEKAADVVFRTDADGCVSWVSPSVSRVLGWRPDEVVGTGLGDLLHPDDVARRDEGRHALAAGRTTSFLVRYRHRDGRWIWMSVSGGPLVDASGAVVGHIGSARDATAEVEAREALELREADFRLLAENSVDIVFRADPTMRVRWVSPSVTGSLGWEPDDVVGHRITEWVHPDDLTSILVANGTADAAKDSEYEARFRRQDGDYQWFSVVVRSVVGDDGQVVARVGSARDISEAVAAREALEESEEMFRSVMDSSAVGMAVVGIDQRFRAVNPALCRLVGRDEEWFHHHLATDLAPPENRERAAADGAAYVDDVRLMHADGTEVWAQRTVVLVRDRAGNPAYVVTQLRDITAELQNEYRKFHDPLTGLRNRDWIVDILEEELRTARRSGNDVGVLFIDLDNFKVVNDSLGHEAGDEVLATVSQRLTASLRPGDHVGRFGGDEFVVVIPDVDEVQDLGSICERVLEGITPQIELRGHRIAPTASMGVAVSTLDSSAQSLLRDADSALYRAKSSGRQRFHFADEAMHQQAVARLTTEDELRRAVAEHELVVHYQPIVRLSDRVVVGHEALVRWMHPERGLVPPLDFLPVAEESGLIVEIGDEVMRLVGEMLAARPDLPNVSVNLSPVQTSRAWWREKLVAQLSEHGVDPRRLSVEVTETAVLSKVDDVARELTSLRELGIGVHLDDFGTGYSSIALLRDLPITGLKLDMSFTRRLTGDGGTTEVLAGGLAQLANGLGMLGIAEGVETEEQAALLAAMGWTHGQGWLFGRPSPDPA